MPTDRPKTTDRWTVERILDRLYDRNGTPAWLLCALEDVRQEVDYLREVAPYKLVNLPTPHQECEREE